MSPRACSRRRASPRSSRRSATKIHGATPEPATFLLGPAGERTVFSLSDVTGITWNQQRRTDADLTPSTVDLSPVRDFFPGAVGTVAFGKYVSPDYEVHPGEYIPPVATRTGTPAAQGTHDIYFNLFLPSGPAPENGWPVAIFGHGNNQSKNSAPSLRVVGSLAAHGIACISINAVAHGLGSASTLAVSRTIGDPITFSAGGRGIDQNGDRRIETNEGIAATRPRSLILWSDALRQTAVDLMQLTRVIQVGVDVDGDGQHDLDPLRIYYLGNSLGGGYGTIFLSVEPTVRAGVLAAAFDPVPGARLGPENRGALGRILNSRQPPLLNVPGITVLAGVTVAAPYFDENLPLRNQIPLTVQLEGGTIEVIQSPVTNTTAGATALQEVIERLEWVSQAGSPAAYAPHLRKAPLRGMLPKSVLYQMAKADPTGPNPTVTAILRAGDLADRTLYYRHDLAWQDNYNFPDLPVGPHGFAVNIVLFGDIALGAQEQSSVFFASDGSVAIRPEPARYLEFPIAGPLPEDLNFIIR